MVGKLALCLVELRGLVHVLFGTGELVCIRDCSTVCGTEFRDKCVAGLHIPVWLCLWVSV